jgi:prepilin-type N-terminal cleavage/methylation domain-containing protein
MFMVRLSQEKYSQGFTLVELLIVIVVIAILAAISIVAYNGIRERAYNSQVIAGVQQYLHAIETYRASEGSYPQTTKEINGEKIAVAYLGSGYSSAYCGKISGKDTYEDSEFNARLSKIASGSSVASINISVGSESFTGAVYGIDIVDSSKSSTGYARTIQYALMGANADCKIPKAWAYRLQDSPPMTACEIVLEVVPSR